MTAPIPSPEDLASRATELGFRLTPDEYRQIENRLRGLRATIEAVRAIDVSGCEPAATFEPQRYE
ncbi:MAG: hypothetical protein HY682_06090 [Chloroflexi bacterium]|nr:hypothetical protein [Chloroflexota bacterium]